MASRPPSSAAPLALGLAAVLVAAVSVGERRGGSVSMGQPNGGSLRGGVRLPDEGPGLYSIPSPPDLDYKYGTDELVSALVKAAAYVDREAPGARLHVGDLSVATGGPTSRHESHQNGRDADLAFYVLDQAGQVARSRVARFDGAGLEAGAQGEGSLRFDTLRNWLVLRALIEDRDAGLQRVLVSEPIRALLLRHARARGEPAWVVERAGDLLCDSWSTHDNHFHVRVFCTAEDYRLGCRDETPMYPWRRTELAAAGILGPEILEDPNRSRERARRWIEASTTGRLWCP
jgi:penicillin-insensitive murein endopeptidase